MASLIPMTKAHFAAFKQYEDLQYAVQLLLYRRRFQLGVLELRKKYHLPERKESPMVVSSPKDIEKGLKQKLSPRLEDKIVLLLRDIGQPYDDEGRWLPFVFLFVTQNIIAAPLLTRYWNQWRDENLESEAKNMKEAYEKVDLLLAQGKEKEAKQLLHVTDRVVYHSPKVKITIQHREIIVALSPDAAQTDDLKPLLPLITKLSQPFSQSKHGEYVSLDFMNELVRLRRDEKKNYAEIASTLGSFNPTILYKRYSRAIRDLGF